MPLTSKIIQIQSSCQYLFTLLGCTGAKAASITLTKLIPAFWREKSTIKLVCNDHPRDPKIVAVIDRWSLFGGRLCLKRSNWNLKIVAVVDRWSLFRGGR